MKFNDLTNKQIYYILTHCPHILDDLKTGDIPRKEADKFLSKPTEIFECPYDICKYDTKTFHDWLQNNNFIIQKIIIK